MSHEQCKNIESMPTDGSVSVDELAFYLYDYYKKYYEGSDKRERKRMGRSEDKFARGQTEFIMHGLVNFAKMNYPDLNGNWDFENHEKIHFSSFFVELFASVS